MIDFNFKTYAVVRLRAATCSQDIMDTDTIDKLFLELSQVTKAKTNRELKMEAALQQIVAWQFPPTGKTWNDGSPMSYGECYGSNGERDFMREIAIEALK